jgi:hypothetical protein
MDRPIDLREAKDNRFQCALREQEGESTTTNHNTNRVQPHIRRWRSGAPLAPLYSRPKGATGQQQQIFRTSPETELKMTGVALIVMSTLEYAPEPPRPRRIH